MRGAAREWHCAGRGARSHAVGEAARQHTRHLHTTSLLPGAHQPSPTCLHEKHDGLLVDQPLQPLVQAALAVGRCLCQLTRQLARLCARSRKRAHRAGMGSNLPTARPRRSTTLRRAPATSGYQANTAGVGQADAAGRRQARPRARLAQARRTRHLQHDVAAAQQLPIHIQLRVGGPLAELLRQAGGRRGAAGVVGVEGDAGAHQAQRWGRERSRPGRRGGSQACPPRQARLIGARARRVPGRTLRPCRTASSCRMSKVPKLEQPAACAAAGREGSGRLTRAQGRPATTGATALLFVMATRQKGQRSGSSGGTLQLPCTGRHCTPAPHTRPLPTHPPAAPPPPCG